MELEILTTRGIPQGGLLSISAGGMRKQVQLSAIDKPLRFASKTEEITQIKVDVLDVLGRAKLPYQATGEQKYTVPLESTSGEILQGVEVDIVMRPCDPNTVPLSPSKEDMAETRGFREAAANGYLEEHGLVNFMQFLLHTLMEDKPTNPYPFLQQEVAKRMSGGLLPPTPQAAQAPAGLNISIPGNDIPPLPLTGPPDASMPLLIVPGVQDSDENVNALLQRLTPMGASTQNPADIANLEAQAESARRKLKEDNEQLRATALQMNEEYERLMRESENLNNQLDAKKALRGKEAKTQEAYVQIDKLQDEVKQLARENAELVQKLARGREMIDLVRQDMIEIQRSVGE